MEYVTMRKNSKKYGLTKGFTYPVLRNVNGECVVIINDGANVVMTAKRLMSYGTLVGVSQTGIASGGCLR